MGIPRGPKSKVYIYDPVNGNVNNTGTSWTSPLLTIEAAYAKCTADQHDVVLALAGAAACNPAAAIAWSKSYTHLIGVGSEMPGLGQRSRVVTQAAIAVTPIITFSGNGCIVKNMQFNQEKATGVASGVAAVTGERNYFENVFFMSPTSATAASFSLKLGGDENAFVRCTIGQLTNFRSEASYGLWLHGAGATSRNKFIDCEFLAWSGGTPSNHAHVYIDADIVTVPWVTWYENCLFHNNFGGGTVQVQAIDDNSTAAGHQTILRGRDNCFAGCTAVADTLTYVFAPDMNGDHVTSGLLMIAVTET